MQSWNLLELVLFALALLVVMPAGVLVHELGHAVVARRFGIRVHELVSTPEGGTLSFVAGGVKVRVGLGLGRDLRSEEPNGWVTFDVAGLPAEQAIAVLRAGPRAQIGYGTIVTLVVLVLGLPLWPTVLLVSGSLGEIATGLYNLSDSGAPGSDGRRIARLRDAAVLEKWGLIDAGTAASAFADDA